MKEWILPTFRVRYCNPYETCPVAREVHVQAPDTLDALAMVPGAVHAEPVQSFTETTVVTVCSSTAIMFR